MRPLQPVQRMHAFPADVQKMCRRLKTEKSHEESCDSSWDFGALVGTRIPGPLIKSQMLYRLSYERISFSVVRGIIPPDYFTTPGRKMQVPA